ncbi:MAG: ComF family protein [Candidatus Gastranaerophilales bacterium]|nr:ComF family protein [Candidatus Gastranaerophilales bacterium]
MINFIKQLLDWIYRKKCYICGKDAFSEPICINCLEEIEINQYNYHKKIHSFEIYSAGIYTANMRKIIKGLKYHRKKDLAKPIASIMHSYWKNLNISSEDFEIVPMPLYLKREKERGYNQTCLIADEFSKLTGYTVNNKIAKRVKNTEPQYKLSKRERIENLKDAFKIVKTEYTGKKLLLLDDISTTGTTLDELKKTFENEGISVYYALVAANPVSESSFH